MSDPGRINLLESRGGRRVLFAALYLSEGAPIGYIWWALPTLLKRADVPIDQITGITASVTLIWALKFLWAPVVDTFRSSRWGLRNWIVLTQILMGVMILPLLFIPAGAHLGTMTVLLVLHALFASTQDASVDALCIASTPHEDRGGINGWMQVGMLGGRAVFGGAALYAERWIGQAGILVCLIVVIWFSMSLVIFFTREPGRSTEAADDGAARIRTVWDRLVRAFTRRSTGFALAFALVGGAAFEAVGAVAGPMLTDLGIEQDRVGLFFALPVVVAMALGALSGGALSDKFGHRRTVGVLTAAIAVIVVALAGAHTTVATVGTGAIVGLLATLYLLYGAVAASSYAMFMDVTDPRLGATQFSTLMAATNLCEVWATYAVGRAIAARGYGIALAAFALVSLLSIPLLTGIRRDPSQRPDRASLSS